MEVFMGTIQPFGFQFAPSGWAFCSGQTLPVSQYQALFTLLGTYYGGNGSSNFQLPNLQGRTLIGQGTGQGLTPREIGEFDGAESIALTLNNLPTHSHQAVATFTVNTSVQVAGVATSPTTVPSATNGFLGASGTGPASAAIYSTQMNTPVPLQGVSSSVGGGGVTIGNAGNGLPFQQMNPFLVINFSIALSGLFPSRN